MSFHALVSTYMKGPPLLLYWLLDTKKKLNKGGICTFSTMVCNPSMPVTSPWDCIASPPFDALAVTARHCPTFFPPLRPFTLSGPFAAQQSLLHFDSTLAILVRFHLRHMWRPCYYNGAQISLPNGILCGSVWFKFASVRSMGSGELAKSRCKQGRVCMLIIRVVILRGIMECLGRFLSVWEWLPAGVVGSGRNYFVLFCFCFPAAFGGLCLKLARVWVSSFSFFFVSMWT